MICFYWDKKRLDIKRIQILYVQECQFASRSDEVNGNVHETLALNDVSRGTEITRKSLKSLFELTLTNSVSENISKIILYFTEYICITTT